MIFEWDAAKNRANLRKHGVDFPTAARVFADPNVLFVPDRADEYGELRWHAIGVASLSGPLLLVVHAARGVKNGEEVIRIISARKASKGESRSYFR